jgi:hypothetical protein
MNHNSSFSALCVLGILVTLATNLDLMPLQIAPRPSLSLKSKARICFYGLGILMGGMASWSLPRVMPINKSLPPAFALGTPGGYFLCFCAGVCIGEMATSMVTHTRP